MKKLSSGYTLMELMITLLIVSILGAVAVPSMRSFVQDERLVSQLNSLLSHLQYARSEALTEHQQVVLCVSSDASTCTSGSWENGWIIFSDLDANGSVSGTDQILKVHDALVGNTTLSSTGGNSVVYDDRGFSPNSNATFSLCDSRGSGDGKSITVSNTGRIRRGGAVSC